VATISGPKEEGRHTPSSLTATRRDLPSTLPSSLSSHLAYNHGGLRVGKSAGAAASDYLVDLAATLPVAISDTNAVYLYGLDILAEQLAGAGRYYYVHDGLGSVRQLVDSAGQIETRYAYDPFGVPLEGNGVPNPWQFTGEAWDAEVELLYLRARYYQPETGRFVTRDPWTPDAWRPVTLNPFAYASNNPGTYIDPTGLEGWGPGGTCPECHPPRYFDPKFGGPYVPLEKRLWDVGDPTALGGQFWLPAAVERDPLVHRVYTRLRTVMEEWPEKSGFMNMTTFVCTAIEAARERIHQYAPACDSVGRGDCDRIVVRVALNGLAATARRTIQGQLWTTVPYIKFEYTEARESVRDIWKEVFPRLQGPLPPFGVSDWDPGDGSYTLEYDGDNPLAGDKAVHFLTHAFMAYEQRWMGADPYPVWRWNDWQGRALEEITEVLNRFGYKERYSVDDVIANRWGAAFGLSAFDDPALLIDHCIGRGCRIGTTYGSLGERQW
jgi:RHS repeat-associated protein